MRTIWVDLMHVIYRGIGHDLAGSVLVEAAGPLYSCTHTHTHAGGEQLRLLTRVARACAQACAHMCACTRARACM